MHGEDSDDHNLPKMIWFALEPLVPGDVGRSLRLAADSKIELVTRHVARRLADAEQYEPLLAAIAGQQGDTQWQLLLGLRDAVEGRYDMASPVGWADLYPKLRASGEDTARIALQLSQQFGDSVAASAMLATLANPSASIDDRRQALTGLAGRKRPELKSRLMELLDDEELRRDAIRAVASFDEPALAKNLLQRYAGLNDDEKLDVVHALSSRSEHGRLLTEAIRRGDVAKATCPPTSHGCCVVWSATASSTCGGRSRPSVPRRKLCSRSTAPC